MKRKKINSFFHNKRALSVAISSVIMTSVVLTLGFVILNWASFRSETFNKEFSDVIDENLDRLKEKIVFEYIYYDSSDNKTYVYLLNYGDNISVCVTNVLIYNTTTKPPIETFRNPELWALGDDPDDPDASPIDVLDPQDEGYFRIDLTLQVDNVYYIKIITKRGVTFVESFIA